MNIAVILSGGVGKRFGAKIPKQYLDLCGKPVINYVIEAALSSKKIDEIVLVIDDDYLDYVEEISNPKIHTVPNGKERVYSVLNALNYINDNYKNCNKLLILQAVSPFITTKIINDYFNLLDEYDVVTTAQKCTGEIFNVKKYKKVNRNDYYFCQSPEAFHFKDLLTNIKVKSKYSELIYHYSFEPKVCFYTDFVDNVKLTTKEDLAYCEFLMSRRKKD